MSSFQISLTPSRREAARFVTRVRRVIQKALAEEEKKRGLTQSDIARTIGVHRSVINREIRGYKDITLGRVAELAYAMGRKPVLDMPEATTRAGANTPVSRQMESSSVKISTTSDTAELPDPSLAEAKAA